MVVRGTLVGNNGIKGTLHAELTGLFAVCTAECPVYSGRVLRAYVMGSRDSVLVGVLEPHEGKMRAKRKISCRELASAGVDTENLSGYISADGMPPAEAETEKLPPAADEKSRPDAADVPDGWSICTDEWKYSDGDIFRERADGVLIKRTEGAVLLAAPIEKDSPFLLMPAFAVCRCTQKCGRIYGVIEMRSGGCIRTPDGEL